MKHNIEIRLTRLRDGRWKVYEPETGLAFVMACDDPLEALEAFCDRCRDLHVMVSTPERRFWLEPSVDHKPMESKR